MATDWLDGYLARRLRLETAFGAFLDPVADKILVAVALVLLSTIMNSLWFAVPAAVIIGREIAVSALREWMAGRQQRPSVIRIAKCKTAFQFNRHHPAFAAERPRGHGGDGKPWIGWKCR